MGSVTLGRAGTGVTISSADAPDRWDLSGDSIRWGGTIRGTTAYEARFLRLNLNGVLDNPDEAVVPFTWTEDPLEWDCFVRVDDISVGSVPLSLTAHWFPFDVAMTRVDGAYTPLVESRLVGGTRTNPHNITDGLTVKFWATPYDAQLDRVAGCTTQYRTGDGGTVKVQYTNGTLLYDTTATWFCAPGDWYDMACKLEISPDGGSTYRTINGRQVLNLPTGWRVSNGLVRLTPAGAGLLDVAHYGTNGWLTAKRYKLTMGVSPATPAVIGTFRALNILRNSPENVIIRLSVEHSSSVESTVNVDLGLRRGSYTIDGTMTRSAVALTAAESASTDYAFGVGRNNAETSTAHTSGLHATAVSNGSTFILSTANLYASDLTNGAIYGPLAATSMQFMISAAPDGAAGADTFTNLVYAWFAAIDERVRLARR